MQHRAFTTRYDSRVRVLSNKVGVCFPLTPEEMKTPNIKLKEYLAIWDTGATHSAITKRVADELGLKPTGIVEVRYGSGKALTSTYFVNISLPNRVMVGQVRVTEVSLIPDDNQSDDQQPQLLVGMDIIGLGDFAVTNVDSRTTFSFRIPSVQEIDFVPEAQENNVMKGGNRRGRRVFQTRKRKGKL